MTKKPGADGQTPTATPTKDSGSLAGALGCLQAKTRWSTDPDQVFQGELEASWSFPLLLSQGGATGSPISTYKWQNFPERSNKRSLKNREKEWSFPFFFSTPNPLSLALAIKWE